MKIAGAGLAAAVLVVVAFLAGSSMGGSKKPRSGLTTFRDKQAGWSISYPKDWLRLQPKAADVAIVVSERPAEQNAGGSILARNL